MLDLTLSKDSAGDRGSRRVRLSKNCARYDEHLRDLHGLSLGTRRGYMCVADRLLRRRFGKGYVDITRTDSALPDLGMLRG